MPYDQVIARHYAAYRPPLHEIILERALAGIPKQPTGLDVGCGTGGSSAALTAFCERVIGVDPSREMLAEAPPHPAVTYERGPAERLPCPDDSVDLVAFAGSLFYVDPAATTVEVRRVSHPDAVALGYDFVVRLEDALGLLATKSIRPATPYDPRADLGDAAGLRRDEKHESEVRLEITPTDLGHVLLAETGLLPIFEDRYGKPDPLEDLAGDIERCGAHQQVTADVFFTRYRVL